MGGHFEECVASSHGSKCPPMSMTYDDVKSPFCPFPGASTIEGATAGLTGPRGLKKTFPSICSFRSLRIISALWRFAIRSIFCSGSELFSACSRSLAPSEIILTERRRHRILSELRQRHELPEDKKQPNCDNVTNYRRTRSVALRTDSRTTGGREPWRCEQPHELS